MRLEKIVLNGFKSFADKTEFTFDSPITAIVGPNGCGKSNVVDAVKWVLGEQSVKSLRSGQMADVIFGGSSSRKAMGTAEVSLIFSNTTGKLPIEADEVGISRRIYKSGESEYRINNKICRLKDVRELFMDTGVAAKAYSIIEQGQVEQLLTASKNDRRIIFEEAAGISKYKAHKKEALRKLDRTDQNLLRLADILAEVQKQLRSVKLQAGKARNYLNYKQRLKELQVNYSLVEYHKITSADKEKRTALGTVEEKFAEISALVAKNDANMSSLGNEIIETENQINQADNLLVSVQSKIEQQFQRIEFSRTRIVELQQRRDDADKKTRTLQEQRKEFTDDLSRYGAERITCQRELKEKQAAIAELEEAIQQINAQCLSLEADLDDEKSGIIDIVRRTAQLHNEVQSISIYRNNLSNQKDRLADKANTTKTELEKLLTEKAQHKARQGDIEKVLEQLQESLDSKRKRADEIGGEIEAAKRRLGHNKEAKSALSSELAVLSDMENRREGLNSGVKSILRDISVKGGGFDYIEGIVADIIEADVEYATAVEAALEGRTDALVVNCVEGLLGDMENIKKLDGKVNFICTDKIEPFVDSVDLSSFEGVCGRLIEFVNYDSKYAPLVWKLLGKTIVVDSLGIGVRLAEKLGQGFRFVTLAGEFYDARGMVKVGSSGKSTGLISRKSRLNQLQEAIGNITGEIADVEGQLENHTQASEHLVKLCKELRTAVYEANTEKMQVASKLGVIEENVRRLSQEQPLLAMEIGGLEEEIAQSVEKEYNSKQKLDELEEVNSQRSGRIEELETKFAEQKQLQQQQTPRLTDLKVAIGQVTEQSKALEQTIESMQKQMEANRSADESGQLEIENCARQVDEAEDDILRCEASVSQLYVEKEKSQHDSRSLHERIEQLLKTQKETEQLVRQKRGEQSEIDQRINQLKIDLSQLEVREQTLIERVKEELALDLVDSYENYEDSDVDWDAVKDEIGQLRGKIERLGNVNIDAIDEQEDLEKRNEFLSSQVEDLNKSQLQLQQLIARLNKQSREKFRETFEDIRIHFQQLFRKLFGGGKADILLEDAEDILEAGIEIIARPPGKETMSISLLSGGEKTMTAIALLFAVFKAKPSPFCLLDEVDAALDEANNERFNLLISEFQRDSQFIIITHSKRTMSMADILYGITMQTRGVSKKISVRFGEEIEEKEEEAAAVA